jgi:farnesyl diphosphate synthase
MPGVLAEPAIDAEFATWMRDVQQRFERVLDSHLPPDDLEPRRLHAAMRYAVLGGGKRVRPLLALAAGALTDAPVAPVERVAVAVELIHAYSLVHDDLPCMDDDVLRRGRPTCHVQFDEPTAMLAGDALQSEAMAVLCAAPLVAEPARNAELMRIFALACGSRGMAGGQAIDLAAVGQSLSAAELERMHAMKTGALIRAAILLGAGCGRTLPPEQASGLVRYANAIGLAFQVVDDILDVEATSATLGKTPGKDALQNKPTYVSVLGLQPAKAKAERLHAEARDALGFADARGDRLREMADFIILRKH